MNLFPMRPASGSRLSFKHCETANHSKPNTFFGPLSTAKRPVLKSRGADRRQLKHVGGTLILISHYLQGAQEPHLSSCRFCDEARSSCNQPAPDKRRRQRVLDPGPQKILERPPNVAKQQRLHKSLALIRKTFLRASSWVKRLRIAQL